MNDSYIYYPEGILDSRQLDVFLSKGWYRMGQGIFTTHYLVQEDAIYRVYWMRYCLDKIEFGKTQQKILNLNKLFSVEIKPLRITGELEKLYSDYKQGLTFDPSPSVKYWLYGDQEQNVFDTDIIEVRDRGKLIAAGIFDKGHETISGIMNFYDHDYKKYSPGKFLMLMKIRYALEAGLQWYYPGYIVYDYPKFDYKLFAGKQAAEIYVPEINIWYTYSPELIDKLEERDPDEN